MQGSARKDVVFGAARVYTATVPGPKWKSWFQYQHVTRPAPDEKIGAVLPHHAAMDVEHFEAEVIVFSPRWTTSATPDNERIL